MSEQPLPCQHGDPARVRASAAVITYWVECADDCARGPSALTPEAAVRLWNDEMKRKEAKP